jgi:AhpD family alkylhydroperoxidase
VIRYLAPFPPPSAATAAIYAGIRREFGVLAEPFTLHTPSPELLAGFWIVCRETTLVGRVPRARKEAVATAVSVANRCPYCVDAHVMMLHAAGDHATAAALGRRDAVPADPTTAALVAWAGAGGRPGAIPPAIPPDDVPELVGTAVAFHYVNRMVSALLEASPFPVRARAARVVLRRVLGWVVSGAVRRPKPPGASLALLPDAPLPPDLAWAAASPTVAPAFARFAAAVARAGDAALSPAARAHVGARVRDWQGDAPGLGRGWVEAGLDTLPPPAAAEARLALLAAFAPWQVDDAAVAAYRAHRPADDAALVGALAWGAFTAARRIGEWIAPRRIC